LYKTLITHVGQRVNDRLARDLDARASGIIVNTCGWIDEEGFPSLMHAIQALSIDIVLVVGHDKLYSTFTTALEGSGRNVTVVKLPRSGGVVTKVRILHCSLYTYFFCISYMYCNSGFSCFYPHFSLHALHMYTGRQYTQASAQVPHPGILLRSRAFVLGAGHLEHHGVLPGATRVRAAESVHLFARGWYPAHRWDESLWPVDAPGCLQAVEDCALAGIDL